MDNELDMAQIASLTQAPAAAAALRARESNGENDAFFGEDGSGDGDGNGDGEADAIDLSWHEPVE